MTKTFEITNDSLRVVAASPGAELISIQKISSGEKTVDYLWNGDVKHWNQRAPILFPIVGRVKNGVYRYHDKIYSIDCPHGFLQSAPMIDESANGTDRLAFVFESNDATLRQYPFPFRFHAGYSLHESMLKAVFAVINTGTETMPFSLGFHPGFYVPIGSDEGFEDCSIRFEEKETPRQLLLDGVWMAEQSTPFPLEAGRTLRLRHDFFANDAVILDSVQKRIVSLCHSGNKPYLTVDYSDFRYLALWQPPYGKPPFLCLEAWNGLPDETSVDIADITRKPGMMTLAPGERYTATVSFFFVSQMESI